MNLSEKILCCRKQCGLSQEDLADILGVSRQAVSKWETGAAVPEADKLLPLAKTFKVTTDWLLSEDGSTHEGRNDESAKCTRYVETSSDSSDKDYDNMPRFISRIVKKYSWLAGVYIAIWGALAVGLGVFARMMIRRMFPHFEPDMYNSIPVYTSTTLFFVIGGIAIVGGVVLATVLKKNTDK